MNQAKTGRNIYIQFGAGYESNPGIIGNEGINAAAFQDYFRGRNGLKYQAEFDGLLVQAVYGELNAIVEGNDSAGFEVNPAGGTAYDLNYWEKGWETPDHATVRAKRKDAINTVLREDQNYGLTPSSKTRVVQVTRRKK